MDVEKLALWNPWWRDSREFSSYYNYSFLVYREVKLPQKAIVRGPRQVGKTTYLIRELSKKLGEVKEDNLVYILADRLSGLEDLRDTVRNLASLSKKRIILIDEITSLNSWEKCAKEAFELGFKGVWISGSRPLALEKSAEFFPGRAKVLNFYPLSFREFVLSMLRSILESRVKIGNSTLRKSLGKWEALVSFAQEKLDIDMNTAQKLNRILNNLEIKSIQITALKRTKKLLPYANVLNNLLNMYLETGGYPSAIESYIYNDSLPYDIVVKDTFGTIEKEGLSLSKLNILLPSLVKSMGVAIEAKSLATQLDEATLSRYLSTLERSFILRKLLFFDGKPHIRKKRKYFFVDPFMARAISNYYNVKIDTGHLIEGLVVEAISRLLERPLERDSSRAMGYGKLKKKEVDIVLPKMKIEVKYKTGPSLKNVDLVLTRNKFSIGTTTKYIPVSFFLATIMHLS